MKKQSTSIYWFRRDLRLSDNPALDWVCANSQRVMFIYIHDEEEQWSAGGASRWWLHKSLSHLEQRLSKLGHTLYCYKGNAKNIIEDLVEKVNATDLVFNRIYESQGILQDKLICESIAGLNSESDNHSTVRCRAFHSGLFFQPGTVKNNQDLPYRVFTPFYKKIRPLIESVASNDCVESKNKIDTKIRNISVVDLKINQSCSNLDILDAFPWHEKLSRYWQPGEINARAVLSNFIDNAVSGYQNNRDIPGVDGTSMLSASLHFGELTPGYIYRAVTPVLYSDNNSNAMNSAEVFIKQLVWREFAHHVLWYFPDTVDTPMSPKFTHAFWHYDEESFRCWTRGETGVPMVDAGMKQLWETGWMHNRVRMIVSSFLTKNLGIHWIHGARWFWDTLLDADLANNTMGWQWVAGCGVDAAPYYRVFNPLTQAKRFDEKLTYINQWLPEYAELDYAEPIVDLAESRKQALQRYKQNIN